MVCQYSIISEIESLLSFQIVGFWQYGLEETNTSMKATMDQKSGDINDMTSSLKCREISFDELMVLNVIIMQIAIKPSPGSHDTECWKTDNKVWCTASNHISKNRFLKNTGSLFNGVTKS